MNGPTERESNTLLRQKIIGLGERSTSKSYYPELRRQLEELEKQKLELEVKNRALEKLMRELEEERVRARNSEDKLYRILKATPDLIGVVAEEDGRFLEISDSWLNLLDRPREHIVGHTVMECGLFPSLDEWKRIVAIMQSSNMSSKLEVQFRPGVGERFTGLLSMVPLEIDHEACVVLEITDITTRKKFEESLRRSEENYRNVIENIQDVFYRSDTAGNLIMASPSLLTLLEYESLEECLGRPIAEDFYFYPEKRADILVEIGKKGSVTGFEVILKKRDGTPVIVETSSHLYYDESGNVAGIEGVFRDISMRLKAEAALVASEQHLKAIIDGSPIPQFVIDRDHRITHWNMALEEYSGVKREEVIGTNQQWRAFYSHERPCLADLIVDGETDRIRELYSGKYSGSRLVQDAYEATDYFPAMRGGTWLYFTAAPIYGHNGIVMGAVETLADITEQKRAEESLRDSLAEKDIILKELYHRTKNNMQVICGMLNLKAADLKDEAAQGIYQDIQSKIQTMALVHQKLYDSKDLSNINLSEYVASVIDLLLRNNELQPGRVTVCHDVDAIPVSIDTAMPLGLVLNELVCNSIKHAFPDGRRGEIDVAMHSVSEGINFEYRDNGIGIPRDFDPSAVETLGLKIIMNLAKMQLGGDIQFMHDNGFGCIISIRTKLYRKRI